MNGVSYVYNALWTQNFHVGKFVIGNIVADDATKGGENDAEWPEINAAAEFRPTAREDIAELMWEPCYRGITRANCMLDILKDKEFDEESPSGYPIVDRLEGECMFIRAFFSYYLVTVFGEVPYFTVPTISNITDDRNGVMRSAQTSYSSTIVVEGDSIILDGKVIGKTAERYISNGQVARMKARGVFA